MCIRDRFCNPSDYKAYLKQVQERPVTGSLVPDFFPKPQFEALKVHQSITDYCHTALRTYEGLNMNSLRQKFPAFLAHEVQKRCKELYDEELTFETKEGWALTDKGALLSNTVFARLLFVHQDIDIQVDDTIINTLTSSTL